MPAMAPPPIPPLAVLFGVVGTSLCCVGVVSHGSVCLGVVSHGSVCLGVVSHGSVCFVVPSVFGLVVDAPVGAGEDWITLSTIHTAP